MKISGCTLEGWEDYIARGRRRQGSNPSEKGWLVDRYRRGKEHPIFSKGEAGKKKKGFYHPGGEKGPKGRGKIAAEEGKEAGVPVDPTLSGT